MTRVCFNFPSQPVHNIFEQHLIPVAVSSPDRLDDILCRKYVARTTHQQMEKTKLEIGQLNLQSSWID